MKKPALGGLQGASVDYLEFKLWKLGAFLALCFVWGIFCGWNGLQLNGRPKGQGPSGTEGAEARGQDSER